MTKEWHNLPDVLPEDGRFIEALFKGGEDQYDNQKDNELGTFRDMELWPHPGYGISMTHYKCWRYLEDEVQDD